MRHSITRTAKFVLGLAMAFSPFYMPTIPVWMTGYPGPDERLTAAIGTNDLSAFNAALADGASLGARGEYSTFALADTSSFGRLEMTRRLIAAGADANATDGSGMTPLMLAATQDYFAVVELLISSGADPSRRNRLGQTALEIAVDGNCHRAADSLRRSGVAREPGRD